MKNLYLLRLLGVFMALSPDPDETEGGDPTPPALTLEGLDERLKALEEEKENLKKENEDLKKVNEEQSKTVKEQSERIEKLESAYKESFVSTPQRKEWTEEVKKKPLDFSKESLFGGLINGSK